MKRFFTVWVCSLFVTLALCQKIDLANGLFGNEWIDYSKAYIKIKVGQDDVYKITWEQLVAQGFPTSIDPNTIRLECFGEEVSCYFHKVDDQVSNPENYLIFYGEKNRSQLDRNLYEDFDKDAMNDRYSIVNDTIGYFLSWGHGTGNLLMKHLTHDYSQALPETRVYIHHDLREYNDFHYKPIFNEQNVRFSSFQTTEGYADQFRASKTEKFLINERVNIGIPPRLECRFGTNRRGFNVNVTANNALVKSYNDPGIRNHLGHIDTILDYSTISNGLEVVIQGSDGTTIRTAYVNLYYTRNANANDIASTIEIPASDQDQYFKIKNYTGEALQVYNHQTNTLYNTIVENNNLIIYLPASDINTTISLVDTVAEPPMVAARQLVDFTQYDYDYLILTSEVLNNADGGSHPIQDYIDYRQSDQGGRYLAGAINVEDLYDQFSYGVDRHFLAIRHFAYFIKKNWTNPQYLFIIGKGREYGNYRQSFQITDPISSKMLVPTYGVPGSDNLLIRQLDKATLLFNLGRLAANTKKEISDYLTKIISHDDQANNPQTISDKLWLKKILHLSGGDVNIQESIRLQLEDMEDIIEASTMAADVKTIVKYSTAPVTVAVSDEIKNLFTSGLSLVTFFGHSSGGNLDFSLGDIKTLKNTKYPIMIALGCNAGNVHGSSNLGVSEQYVIAGDNGMVGFLASVGNAYAYQQYEYGRELYSIIGNDNYGLPLSVSINAVIDSFAQRRDVGTVTFLEQVTLHGDPGLKLFLGEGADLTPNPTTARTIPENVNSYDDEFQFCVDVTNLGLNTNDSSDIRLIHSLPSGEVATDTTIRISMPGYIVPHCFTLPITDNAASGLHNIQLTLDANGEISELPNPDAELNNELIVNGHVGYSFVILNNAAKPIFPKEFGIIDIIRPTLLASTYNALGEARDYMIELDTSGAFDSPSLIKAEVKDVVALVEWQVPQDLIHNTVYYWRVSPDTVAGEPLLWEASSFLYHKDIADGWNQSHYHQFLRDDYENVKLNSNTRKFEFERNFSEIQIVNRPFINTNDRPHFYVTGNSFNEAMDSRVGRSMAFSIIDSTGRFIKNPKPGIYNSINNYSVPITTYYFKTASALERSNIYDFWDEFILNDNLVPGGSTVIIHFLDVNGTTRFDVENWASDTLSYGNSIFKILESVGGEKYRLINDNNLVLPYVLVFKKDIDQIELVGEFISENLVESVTANVQIPGFWNEGNINSTLIGPASRWKSLQWEEIKSINPDNDTTYLNIVGVSESGIESLLRSKVIAFDIDISDIDAVNFPFLKLQFYTKDERDRTSSQLVRWRTDFDGIPDLAFDYDDTYRIYKDSIQEGDSFTFNIPIINYTLYDMPGTIMAVSLVDKQNKEIITTKPVPPIAAGQRGQVSFAQNTTGMEGDYLATILVNPAENPMENYYYNNFASYNFQVYKEYINPVIDVTFDGIHILDNDIVSPKPSIALAVKDENPYLLLNDTSQVSLSLTYPDGTEETISMDDPRLVFNPATSGADNEARILFNPSFDQEGTYSLSVNASDRTGNITGSTAYSVSFQVILESQISEVYNYPNPFSTSTEFIFTLTGEEVPQDFTIQIMTVSGKVVKEIDRGELGPIRIGVNRSQYKWDGRDEYGQRLGNGVYLYRILTKKSDGSAFQKLQRSQDSTFFKKGWGKMVIMR